MKLKNKLVRISTSDNSDRIVRVLDIDKSAGTMKVIDPVTGDIDIIKLVGLIIQLLPLLERLVIAAREFVRALKN